MARRLRIHVPGGFFHVTLRGNHRQPIFRSVGDRELLDDILAETLGELGARVHAYCWMTNHIHVLAQVADAPLGMLVQRIASRYARAYQARLETTGHLFERRYHAVLVDVDRYLLTLVRYIHLNPVRGGLARDPADYPWSSHRDYLGAGSRPWVHTDFALRTLSADVAQARRAYVNLMSGADEPRWGSGTLVPHPDNPQVLGDDEFLRSLAESESCTARHSTLEELLLECASRFSFAPAEIVGSSRSRKLAVARAWLTREALDRGIAGITTIARRLGRSDAALRGLIGRHPRQSSQ